MNQEHTLASMFESNKQALEKELKGLVLPKDANKIQSVVSHYFDELFNKEGEFRQNLTQAEDYILQAALSLLNAQQELARKLSEKNNATQVVKSALKQEEPVAEKVQRPFDKCFTQQIDGTKTLMGAGGGAIVGKLVMGSWGAVFGAIAGAALVLYMATEESNKKAEALNKRKVSPENTPTPTQPIDTGMFLEIIAQTCQSIDTLIATFRNQIKSVVDKYESQEKPILEREYSTLIESIQSLLGMAYSNRSDEERLRKIDQRIEQMVDALENYDLEVVRYSEGQKHLFEEMTSEKVTEPTMVCPAIMKKGAIVIKGKVFVRV